MEPERPIEKFLRDSARKRREQGGSFELHPATRRLLQGEVTRQYGPGSLPSRNESSFFARWLKTWPKLALGIGCVALLITASLLFIPTRQKEPMLMAGKATAPADEVISRRTFVAPEVNRDRDDMLKASQQVENEKQVAAAEQRLALKTEKDAHPGVESPASPPPTALPAETSAVRSDLSESMASGTPEPKEAFELQPGVASAVVGAEKSGESATSPVAATPLAMSQVQTRSQAVLTAAYDRTNAPLYRSYGGRIEQVQAPRLTQRFVETESTKRKISDASNAPVPSVLVSFQVEREGQLFTVTDSDGSIYRGQIQAAFEGVTPFVGTTVLERSRGTPVDKAKGPALSGAGIQPVQNYRFQVAGTNRSLNRKVVFSGNLVGVAEPRPTDTNSQALSKLSWTQSRISGKAVVGAGTELEINAVPAK